MLVDWIKRRLKGVEFEEWRRQQRPAVVLIEEPYTLIMDLAACEQYLHRKAGAVCVGDVAVTIDIVLNAKIVDGDGMGGAEQMSIYLFMWKVKSSAQSF